MRRLPPKYRTSKSAFGSGSRTGLQLLGVDLDEPAAKIQGLVDDTGVTYPVCLDPGGALFAEVTVPKAGVTRNVVVDRGEHRVPDPVVR